MVEFVHEAYQPLTVVRNYVSIAQRCATSPSDESARTIAESLTRVQTELDRLQSEVQRVRSFLETGQAPSGSASILAAVREAHARVERDSLASRIELSMDLPSEDVRICVEPCRAGLVVENLLRNACEAIGRRPGVGAGSADPDDASPRLGTVETEVRRDGARVELRVTDDGPGIPPEHRERILRPFYSTKEGGMGLGLSFCRRVVERVGGSLRVEPGPLVGTVVIAEFQVSE